KNTSFLFFLFYLLVFLCSLCTVSTVGDMSVLEGQSVTVPCHYNPQYTSHVKYWCQGRMKEFCTSLARTDEPESAPNGKGRVTIADDPTQHVFAVSMRELTEEDSSGTGHCLYISVIQGMSVVSSLLSADEGSSVSVQCLYSKNLR
uniref:Immunoglobulin V-set domain-containing protein n=1 Tax=Sinocyclocheilus rhinocerous TaxID=307959 RepID=A0A673LK38_9TELE